MYRTSQEIRKAYFDFWTSAPRNAKEIPNVSLVPNNDPTLLFVNSGMFPLNPYLSGQPHPSGTRLCNFQRCLRTKYDEMIEVGDNRHTLMFEMMGDWSLGDFTKTSHIPWILEFWVKILGMDPSRLYVTVFEGNADAPRDDVAIETWKKAFATYGIEAEFTEDITNIPQTIEEGKTWKYRIFPYPKKKNWWQRAADAVGELGGPTSEMFYDFGTVDREQDQYHINDDSGRFVEIGNNVFMEYKYGEDRTWHLMDRKNIDMGCGFERVVMAEQNKTDIFETDIYANVLEKVAELSGQEYKTDGKENEFTRYFRILADHGRAATFILADGVLPSNKDQGYILRRFIRRLVRYGMKLGIEHAFTGKLAESVIETMQSAYPHLKEHAATIIMEIVKEEEKFRKTLASGLKELQRLEQTGKKLDGKVAFYMYESFGFPLEMSLDELHIGETEAETIEAEFKAEETAHRELSRSGAEQKFAGGLADQSVETTKLHTAHHLLLAALQKIISPTIKQRGSNITSERLRIDFNYDGKITPEQLAEVEKLVNEKISERLPVLRKEMSKTDAEKLGAQMEFGQKYPDVVSIYIIGGTEKDGAIVDAFSMEFCGGPHVSNTSELADGKKSFKIFKEEASGAGIRRIKAGLV